MTSVDAPAIRRLPTHISGFDVISAGGLPQGRTTVVVGSAGSGKTIFAAQFLVSGARNDGGAGVFVTFEEPAEDIRTNMAGFGWDIAGLEAAGKWLFVDASADPEDDAVIVGSHDLGGLLARIGHAVQQVGATRVALDSLGAIFARFPDTQAMRSDLLRISTALKRLGVTTVMTAERTEEYGEIARYGIEEFVADNVVILRNVLGDEQRRRTIEVLKFRGTHHQKGEFPLTITPTTGVIVVPLSGTELKQRSSDVRVSSGVADLDAMCGGGFFRDSCTLVSGATGTGKTMLVTEFIQGGAKAGERSLLFAFEESREQLGRNATGWGVDFDAMERDGLLRVICQYPEMAGPEDHLVQIKELIRAFRPDRVAVDSLSAIQRVTTQRSFREFVLGLTAHLKELDIAALVTSTTERLLGGASITEGHISTVTDSIILLRYVERHGAVHRGLTVLKMRGSEHDKSIREFTIDGSGMHIGPQITDVTGILAGTPISFDGR